MRLDSLGLIGVIVAIVCLILPWVSVATIYSYPATPYREVSQAILVDFNLAPLYVHVKAELFENLSTLSSQEEEYWQWNSGHVIVYSERYILQGIALLLGICALFLAAAGLCAFDSWRTVGEKARVIAATLWMWSVILHLCSMSWLGNEMYHANMLAMNVSQVYDSFQVSVGYLNLGSFAAILSSLLLFTSWLSPTPIRIPTFFAHKRFQPQAHLPKIPEREKLPAMLLAASLATLLFYLWYNLSTIPWAGSFLTSFTLFSATITSSWILSGRFIQKKLPPTKTT